MKKNGHLIISFFYILLVAVAISCKEAPTVSPKDVYGTTTPGAQPGYNYPFVTDVYPADASVDVPTDSGIIIVFNKLVLGSTITSPNLTIDAYVARASSTIGGNTTVTITDPNGTTDLAAGMTVTGINIQPSTTINSIVNATDITLTAAPLTTATPNLSFSETLGEGVDYTITAPASTNYASITFIGSYSPLPYGFNIQTTTTAGITDGEGNALDSPSSYTFTVGTTPDSTAPTILGGSASPTGTGVSISAPGISIQFTETNDLALWSINSSTIYLAIDATSLTVPCIINYNSITETITLTPSVTLQEHTTYRVTVTTGIEDLSGNNLSAGTSWTFETAYDTTLPGLDSGPEIFAVTDTEAQINWVTDEPTSYVLEYGRGDNTASSVSDLTSYTVNHAVVLNSLTPGRRYYAEVTEIYDIEGNASAAAPTTLLEFNTATNESVDVIHSDNDTYGFNYILNSWGVASSGLFGFWTHFDNPNSEIYGQLITTPYNEEWNSSDGRPLFTGGDYSYSSAVEDGLGGVVAVVTSSSGVSAKRINADGSFFDWDGVASDAGAGLVIDNNAAATDAYAVPVYSGLFTQIRYGGLAVDMASLGLSNWFFDDDVDLSGFANGSDIIITWNGSSYDDTTVVTTGQDFNYIIGQATDILDTPDTYFIGDASSTETFTARDHDMNTGTDYTSGVDGAGQYIYSQTGITPTLGAGDIVYDGTNYGIIDTRTTLGGNATIYTEPAGPSAYYTDHLVDVNVDFTTDFPDLNTGDYVRNSGNQYAEITAISAHELTLTAVGSWPSDLFTSENDPYWIYDTLATGTNEFDIIYTELYDSGSNIQGAAGVSINDIVLDLNDGNATTISGLPVDPDALWLTVDNLTAFEPYAVLEQTPITSGNINPIETLNPNYLYDYTVTFNAAGPPSFPVQVGDLVENTDTGDFARVITVNAHSLVLDDDSTVGGLFGGASPDLFSSDDGYRIFRQWDQSTPSAPTGTFYRYDIDWGIGTTDGTGVTVYAMLATGIIEADDDNPGSLDLVDSDENFTTGTAVATGDIAVNLTDFTGFQNPNIATVDDITYAHALGLNNSIFSDGDGYGILRIDSNLTGIDQNDIIDSGYATSVSGTTLNDTNANPVFTGLVSPGDIIYNFNDNDYAIVTAVNSNTQLALSRNAQFGANDRYLIVRARGILYVWQESGTVYGRILTMDISPVDPTPLRNTFTIAAGATTPRAIPDEQGNALVLYRDSAGELQVTKRNCAGAGVWTTEVDTQTAAGESVVKVMPDEAGGIIVLYRYSNDIHVQRIDSTGARSWGGNGLAIDNDGGTTVTSQEEMVYIPADDDVIVAAVINNATQDIRVWRTDLLGTDDWGPLTITSGLTSNQQNPQIFYNGDDTLITWDDDRFESFSAWGIFGIKINADSGGVGGVVDATWTSWTANSGGATDDYNGVAFIFNIFNDATPEHVIVPFNDGADGLLIWTDRRGSSEGDIVSYDLLTIEASLP